MNQFNIFCSQNLKSVACFSTRLLSVLFWVVVLQRFWRSCRDVALRSECRGDTKYGGGSIMLSGGSDQIQGYNGLVKAQTSAALHPADLQPQKKTLHTFQMLTKTFSLQVKGQQLRKQAGELD